MVDHVGVDDGVDDGLAHVTPATVVHVSQHVRMRLVGQQRIQQRHVAVLQHAVVVVQPRVLVPRVYQEGIVQACAKGWAPSTRSHHVQSHSAFGQPSTTIEMSNIGPLKG